MSGERKINFEDWISELNKLPNIYGPGAVTDHTGVECWRDYYDDDYCPEDALAEDEDHAD